MSTLAPTYPRSKASEPVAVSLGEQNSKSEEYVKCLFENYQSVSGTWSHGDIRRFLLDYLLPKHGYPLFAPDEVVNAALSELQLNHTADGVSWVEFKSYFLYLHQDPVADLFAAVSFLIPVQALVTNAIVITGLALDVDYTRDNIFFLLEPFGPVNKLYLQKDLGQALAILHALSTDAVETLNGAQFCARAIHVQKYEASISFPLLEAGKPKLHPWLSYSTSIFAKASVYIENFDKEHGFSTSVAAFDAKYGISETAKYAVDKTVEAAGKVDESLGISKTIAKTNEEFKISENVHKATGAVLSLPAVQSGLSFFSSFAASVSSTLHDINDDTKGKILEEKAKQPDQTPQPGSLPLSQ